MTDAARQKPAARGLPAQRKRRTNNGRSGNPARAAVAPTAHRGPLTWRDWVGGARLRTLPLAISPVALGTGARRRRSSSYLDEPFHPWRFVLALIVALALQIGVNYANDYSDGIRGTDAHGSAPRA